MFDWIKARVLRLMKVPHEPEPPIGAPGSVRVFRAGINYYRLKLVRWALGQSGALVGIGFSLVFLGALEVGVNEARRTAAASPEPTVEASPSPEALPAASASGTPRLSKEERQRRRQAILRRVVSRTPSFVMPMIEFFELLGIVLFVVQALMTYALVRLEFEQHWYIVTDRSLRIRTGILRLQEATMSFANIQQVEIRQGPLQRLLGLADVCVRSAGGGDPAGPKGHGLEPSLHMGIFEGVTNAVEIRDLMLERLRRFREAGLGDPEDAHATVKTPKGQSGAALEAAAEVLKETRALRRALL